MVASDVTYIVSTFLFLYYWFFNQDQSLGLGFIRKNFLCDCLWKRCAKQGQNNNQANNNQANNNNNQANPGAKADTSSTEQDTDFCCLKIAIKDTNTPSKSLKEIIWSWLIVILAFFSISCSVISIIFQVVLNRITTIDQNGLFIAGLVLHIIASCITSVFMGLNTEISKKEEASKKEKEKAQEEKKKTLEGALEALTNEIKEARVTLNQMKEKIAQGKSVEKVELVNEVMMVKQEEQSKLSKLLNDKKLKIGTIQGIVNIWKHLVKDTFYADLLKEIANEKNTPRFSKMEQFIQENYQKKLLDYTGNLLENPNTVGEEAFVLLTKFKVTCLLTESKIIEFKDYERKKPEDLPNELPTENYLIYLEEKNKEKIYTLICSQ